MAGLGLLICLIVALVPMGIGPCVAQGAREPAVSQGGPERAGRPTERRGLFIRRPAPITPIKSLTIAVWSMPPLPQAAESGYRLGGAAQRWRNTFGAERRSAAWRWLGPAGLDADIVLLQGIVDVGTARRLFKVRNYSFIISRQILIRPRKTAGVTGVLVRRRPGLGIVNVQHIWWRPQNYPLPPIDAVNALPSAITAVRLRAGRQQLWLASIAAGRGCTPNSKGDSPPIYEPGNVAAEFRCHGFLRLKDYFNKWIAGLPPGGDPILLAGTGAVDEMLAKRGKQAARLRHDGKNCGQRGPQLVLLPRETGGKPDASAHTAPSKPQPSLGPARRAAKRKCALLADVNLQPE